MAERGFDPCSVHCDAHNTIAGLITSELSNGGY